MILDTDYDDYALLYTCHTLPLVSFKIGLQSQIILVSNLLMSLQRMLGS